MTNKEKEPSNYSDELVGKIVFSKREPMEQYRIEDFEKRVEAQRQENDYARTESEIEEKEESK